MSTFSDELQALLDKHPEVEEVKVKYKKAGTTFKPRSSREQVDASRSSTTLSGVPVAMSEVDLAAEMIKKGEL